MTENTDLNSSGDVEETYETNADGVYTSESDASADTPARPATIAPGAATGRRKEAVARVRIVPGTGEWRINGRTLDNYFPNKLHQQIANEPFAELQLEGRFDVIRASTVAAPLVRPAPCASAWPARSTGSTPTPTARPSRRPVC